MYITIMFVLFISALTVASALLLGMVMGRMGDFDNIHTDEIDSAFETEVTEFVTYSDRRKIHLPKY